MREKHSSGVFPFLSHCFTSNTRPVGFPHTSQFWDTSWVSYVFNSILTQSTGGSGSSHGLRAQSYKTAPFRCQS